MNGPQHVSRRRFLAAGSLIAGASAVPLGNAQPAKVAAASFTLRGAAHVLTMDEKLGNLVDADVQVRDGRIVAVGAGLAQPGDEIIDARGMIVMPGLIDTHSHMWNCLWRTLDTPYVYGHARLGPQYRPEDSYNAVRLCAAEYLAGGITTVHAWQHNARTRAHVDAELKALSDMGIRTLCSYGWTYDMPAEKATPMDDVLRVRKQWQGELITIGFASRADATDGAPPNQWPSATPQVRKMEWEFARRERLPITHHVATPASKPQAYIDLAGPDVLLVHGYQWGLEVWRELAKLGTKISVSPYSAVVSYRTPAPFREMFQAGVQVSLSFDHMNRTGNADMFRTLQFASNIEHLRTGTGLTHKRALELGTIDGARALGLGEVTGSLTPGKRADLIMIRTDDLNMAPVVSPERAVVMSARPENVDTVIVGGRVVKRKGELIVGDAKRIAHEAAASLKGILERVPRGG